MIACAETSTGRPVVPASASPVPARECPCPGARALPPCPCPGLTLLFLLMDTASHEKTQERANPAVRFEQAWDLR